MLLCCLLDCCLFLWCTLSLANTFSNVEQQTTSYLRCGLSFLSLHAGFNIPWVWATLHCTQNIDWAFCLPCRECMIKKAMRIVGGMMDLLHGLQFIYLKPLKLAPSTRTRQSLIHWELHILKSTVNRYRDPHQLWLVLSAELVIEIAASTKQISTKQLWFQGCTCHKLYISRFCMRLKTWGRWMIYFVLMLHQGMWNGAPEMDSM